MGACTSKPVVADGGGGSPPRRSSRQGQGGGRGQQPAGGAAAPIVTGAPQKGKAGGGGSGGAAAGAKKSGGAPASSSVAAASQLKAQAPSGASAAAPLPPPSAAAKGSKKPPLPPGGAGRASTTPTAAGADSALDSSGKGSGGMTALIKRRLSGSQPQPPGPGGGGGDALSSSDHNRMKKSGSFGKLVQNGVGARQKQPGQGGGSGGGGGPFSSDDGVAGSPAALALQGGMGGAAGGPIDPVYRSIGIGGRGTYRSRALDDPRWIALYRTAVPQILDPADVHSGIDERLRSAVDALSPTEVTMLLRRVRDVMRTVAGPRSSGSEGTGSKIGGVVPVSSGTVSGMMGRLVGAAAAASGQVVSSSSYEKGGGGGDGSGGDFDLAKSKSVYKAEGTLDEGVVRRVFSGGEAVLRRGYDLDVPGNSRRVFVRRKEMNVASTKASAASVQGSGAVGGDYSRVDAGSTANAVGEAPLTPTRRTHLWKSSDAGDDTGGGGGGRSGQGKRHSRHNGSGKSKGGGGGSGGGSLDASLMYRADPVGSAFVLGLHLAESRWDAVAAVARLSAKLAGLEMDVNKSKIVRDGKKKKEAGEKEGKAVPSPSAGSLTRNASEMSEGPPAPPPPDVPSAEAYRDAILDDKELMKVSADLFGDGSNSSSSKAFPPPLPGGVTLAALSFLAASALRGTRSQRLALLFYLLLPAEELRALLARHPAGGVPTWLLEAGGDAVISYASLGHYWYLGGELPEGIESAGDVPKSSDDGGNRPAGRLPGAVVAPPRAVGAVAVLLMDALEAGVPQPGSDNAGGGGGGGGGGGFDGPARSPVPTPGHRSDSGKSNGGSGGTGKRNSQSGGAGLKSKAQRIRRGKGHAALNARLHDARSPSGFPGSGRGSHPWHDGIGMNDRETIMDKFWRASHEAYAPAAPTSGETKGELAQASNAVWTLDDFIQWADAAGLDDHVLDMVTHRLFGTGVLPTPSMEAELVSEGWMEWQRGMGKRWSAEYEKQAKTNNGSRNRNGSDSSSSSDEGLDDSANGVGKSAAPFVWGGVGGVDGRGGLGYGVLYCVDAAWWDGWKSYSGFKFAGDADANAADSKKSSDGGGKKGRGLSMPLLRDRPHELSTEGLLDRQSDGSVATGTSGSYEEMRTDVRPGVDYVLVPPGVWDILYELYGGGPPVPRMVLPPNTSAEGMNGEKAEDGGFAEEVSADIEVSYDEGTKSGTPLPPSTKKGGLPPAPPLVGPGASPTSSSATSGAAPTRLPPQLSVYSHPWVLHCHACDPRQPYRRGDAGPASIRVMVAPDQPLWRLFGEIAVRLPILHPKARDSNGRGRARLWRKIDPPVPAKEGGGAGAGASAHAPSPAITRYGPWMLLCKSRWASFPFADDSNEKGGAAIGNGDDYSFDKKMKDEWLQYADHSSCESAGLTDGSKIMFEYALVGKDGNFAWPREAAAKAGRMRRLADEDTAFRRMLRGLDSTGKVVAGPSPLIGKVVDAMDSSGRWYQAEIVKVHKASVDGDDDAEEEPPEEGADEANASSGNGKDPPAAGALPENRVVRVDFSEAGGHEEWIDVKSDRLAVAGRFTLDSIKNLDSGPGGNEETDAKPPQRGGGVTATGKARPNVPVSSQASGSELGGPNGAICSFPGYGACGLTNLGNTCYANSALQCITYMPLLRSYLLSGQYKLSGDLNKDNPLGTGGKLLEEFVELLRVMWAGKHGARAPSRFRGQLGRARNQYAGADQQDAQELLNDMLDALHEDSNKVKKKPYVEALEDDWVKHTGLPRVGTEAWRRFLRRNRSVIADVAMGQALNRVTCPVCQHESRNFDPFNMLSIPFPTVAEVIFRCRVVRRGTARNCPDSLALEMSGSRRGRSAAGAAAAAAKENGTDEEVDLKTGLPSPPSERLVLEEYIVPMSRLADVGDLKLRLQNISGISMTRLKLCKAEGVVVSPDAPEGNPTRTYVKVTPLLDKEGPCLNLANKSTSSSGSGSGGGGAADDVSAPVAPTQIVAFESTLSPRPSAAEKREDSGVSEESNLDEEDDADAAADNKPPIGGASKIFSPQQRRMLHEHLDLYGNVEECRMYDTNPTPLSKAMSRSLWPSSAEDFKLGLRVDAIDHRNHWFPGSVVEIIEGIDDSDGEEESGQPSGRNAGGGSGAGDDSPPTKTKVRIHFDNFSSKWDETYTIDHFKRGRVRPLYSHAPPRAKPTEFLVHHRHRVGKGNALFGQPFYLQCHNEWSTARAGAQILAQAARFLQPAHLGTSAVVGTTTGSSSGKENGTADGGSTTRPSRDVVKSLEHARAVLSQIIDMLLESDRSYVEAALRAGDASVVVSSANGEKAGGGGGGEDASSAASSSSRPFNATVISSKLSKKLSALLPQLPFDVRVCTADAPLGRHQGGSSDEVTFPFSLVRTIGNYMDARHAVVLHWKDRSGNDSQSRSSSTSSSMAKHRTLRHPLLYVQPSVGVHKRSRALLNGEADAAGKDGGGGDEQGSDGGPPRKSAPGHGGMRLGVCLNEFCKEQHLPATDNWRCPKCREVREGRQHMILWKLPDILVFHLKRFNCSARWREKITTKVNFPLTGLNMSEWCDQESPALDGPEESCVYDLIGVVNHYGGMTGGHYVATCKATACSADGSEEVAYNFNGAGISAFDAEEETVQTGWRLGRSKDKDSTTAQTKAAMAAARSVAESAEPLWLQFDDDLVEPIPPKNVVSEMAYVLFYRRRRISPSNIAKYSTLE